MVLSLGLSLDMGGGGKISNSTSANGTTGGPGTVLLSGDSGNRTTVVSSSATRNRIRKLAESTTVSPQQ